MKLLRRLLLLGCGAFLLLILFLVFMGFGQGNEPEAESTIEAVGSDEVVTEDDELVGAPEQINDSVGTAEQQ